MVWDAESTAQSAWRLKKGRKYSENLEAKALSNGRTTQERSDAQLARIHPTANATDAAGADLVIDAEQPTQLSSRTCKRRIVAVHRHNRGLGGW
jgi:3-hydroxyacyl-CoA dehydrogenase